MPRRKPLRHFHREIPDDDFTTLLLDGASEDCESPFAEFIVNALAESLWEQQREQLLANWIRHSPGCRPWPWWAFDAPELRRQTGGEGGPDWAVENKVAAVAWGIPVRWQGGEPIFETQAAFIERHHLLLDGERSPIREPHPVPAGAMHWQVYRPYGSDDPPLWRAGRS